jgi:phage-related protein
MSEKREIKTTLAIDGEKQFKAAMDEAYRGLKVLGSEMKLNTAIFGDSGESMEGLAKKGEILSKQIAQQKEIVASLSQAVKDSADAYGESDKRTDAYRIKLNNAEAALVRMEGELEDNEEAIKGYGKETENADKKTGKWRESLVKVGDTLAKGVAAGAKAAAVAVGAMAVAAGAAAVKLGKEAVKSFAEYEQLVGGVDTLFKGSSKLVQEYATNAYKTAGLSANAYMETVTGFSASLIQSLNGDTAKAAKIADMAISDMSDNANKMGTDMSSLQSAYQGFAKQNYTMLDNLKLGYGGTKTEMERLLADASKIAGVKFDISSYSDVIQAINVMQQSMGIAGTTALEATETISGSMNSTKAAVQNLITGLGVAGADVGALVGNVVESFGNLVKNITPVIETMITALPVMITGIMEAVSGMLPMIIETVTRLFAQVMTMLVSLLPQLTPVAVDALLTIVRALIDNLPMILTAASQVITGLVDGLQAAIPQLIPAAVAGITTFVSGIISVLPKIIKAGVEMLSSLLDGITKSIPQLIPAAVDGVMTVVDTIIDNLPQVIDSGIKMVVALIKGIIDSLPKIIAAMPQLVQSLVKGIMDNIENIIMSGVDLVLALIDGIIKSLPEIVAAMPQIIGTMVTALVQGIPKLFDVGIQMIKGIWEGIKSMATWFWEQLKQWFSDALGWIGKLLGIKSPSRVMAEQIGKPMAQGVAVGILKNAGLVNDAMESIVPDTSGMLGALGNFDRISGPVSVTGKSSLTVSLDESALDRLAAKLADVVNLDGMAVVLNDREMGRYVRKAVLA